MNNHELNNANWQSFNSIKLLEEIKYIPTTSIPYPFLVYMEYITADKGQTGI
jgi:hypothetical protein